MINNHEYWIEFSGDYKISMDARFPNFGEALAFCDLFMDLYPGTIFIESLSKMKDSKEIQGKVLKSYAKTTLKAKTKTRVSPPNTNVIPMKDYSNRQDGE